MVDLTEWQKEQIRIYRDRLGRVKRGDSWGSGRPGPYTPEETSAEIARIEGMIARLEAGDD
jgi:hypothetical protein